MGKMYEALKQNGTKRCPTVDGVPLNPQWLEHITHLGDKDEEEEIPFIEVGGPRTTMEASASVLASVPTLKAPLPESSPPARPPRPAHVPAPSRRK